VTAAAALSSWLALRRAVTGGAAILFAVAVAGAGAARAMVAADAAERPALMRWFERESGGTPAGESRIREPPVRVRGMLVRDAEPTPYGAQLQLSVAEVRLEGAWRRLTGGVAISVSGTATGDLGEWRAGRTVVVPVGLRRPTRYRNLGLPDQARSLALRGTPLVGSTKSGLLVEVEAHGTWGHERAADVRAAVRRAMHAYVAPFAAASAAIGTAILIGDRAQLSPELEQRLQQAGTYHVVAISGGNIALLAGAVLAMLWAIGIRFAPAAAVTAAVLMVHAWVIGGGSSVVRATAMASTYLALRLIDQRTQPLHAVAVSAALILLADPLEIASAGFWLTFGATGALLVAAARWRASSGPRWWTPVMAIAVASLAVELVLMPVAAFVFERVTIAGLALNLAAVPAMGAVQGAASLCVIADTAGFSSLAAAFGYLTHLAAAALVDSSSLVTLAPWTTWRVPPPHIALLVTYYLAVGAWWRLSRPPLDSLRRRRAAHGARLAVLVLWIWIAAAPLSRLPSGLDGPLRVTAIDVGQGDAFLVTAPDGQTLLVDAGGLAVGGFDIGDRVVGPALRARGLLHLDYLAITHGDVDHLGGAASLIRDFGPREIWAGVPVSGYPPLAALRVEARVSRTPWRWLQRGDRLELGGALIVAHHPAAPEWERQRVRNEDSLVLEVRYRGVSVWLTGDITAAVEEELAASAVDRGQVVILKAAHHGSRTSSTPTFVKRLQPAVVLVSAGRGNQFGHPAPAVLQRYADVGAEVFRTDEDGQIELVTNGISVEVTTFTGRRWRLR
jgi:competence protein ComEC